MITFTDDSGSRFNYRVAAAIVDGERILLHRAKTDDYWTLPGGRAEMGETSRESLSREMREELGCDVQIERLLWLAEYFFDYRDAPCHEIALYFLVTLPEGDEKLRTNSFEVEDGGAELLFQWPPLASVSDMEIYPAFLRKALQSPPNTPVHIA